MISVIIPTLNEQDKISTLLSSLSSDINESYEVIVVDGGSEDDTIERIHNFPKVILVNAEKGRAIQFNQGAERSKGDVLFFIHADSKLPSLWKEQIEEVLDHRKKIGGTFYLKFDKEGFWYRLYSRLSKINNALCTYGDQGLFVRRVDFEKIGGYPTISIMEDYEILNQLRKKGRVIKLDSPIITSARKFSKNGVVLQQLKNMAIVLMYILGVRPTRLAKWYNR